MGSEFEIRVAFGLKVINNSDVSERDSEVVRAVDSAFILPRHEIVS